MMFEQMSGEEQAAALRGSIWTAKKKMTARGLDCAAWMDADPAAVDSVVGAAWLRFYDLPEEERDAEPLAVVLFRCAWFAIRSTYRAELYSFRTDPADAETVKAMADRTAGPEQKTIIKDGLRRACSDDLDAKIMEL